MTFLVLPLAIALSAVAIPQVLQTNQTVPPTADSSSSAAVLAVLAPLDDILKDSQHAILINPLLTENKLESALRELDHIPHSHQARIQCLLLLAECRADPRLHKTLDDRLSLYATAVNLLQSVQADPGTIAVAFSKLAECQALAPNGLVQASSEYDKGLTLLKDKADAGEAKATLLVGKARMLRRMGLRHEEALSCYRDALFIPFVQQRPPLRAFLHVLIAETYVEHRDLVQADASVQAALDDCGGVDINLAVSVNASALAACIRLHRSMFNEALRLDARLLAILPDDPICAGYRRDAQWRSAVALKELLRPAEAVPLFETAAAQYAQEDWNRRDLAITRAHLADSYRVLGRALDAETMISAASQEAASLRPVEDVLLAEIASVRTSLAAPTDDKSKAPIFHTLGFAAGGVLFAPPFNQASITAAGIGLISSAVMDQWQLLVNMWPMLNSDEQGQFWSNLYGGVQDVCAEVFSNPLVAGRDEHATAEGFSCVLVGKMMLADIEYLRARRAHMIPSDPDARRNWELLAHLRRRLVDFDKQAAAGHEESRGNAEPTSGREDLLAQIRGAELLSRFAISDVPPPTLTKVTVADVRGALTAKDLLIEYVEFSPTRNGQLQERADPRMGAFVVDGRGSAIRAIDLGSASRITTLVDAFRSAIQAHAQILTGASVSAGLHQRLEQEVATIGAELRKVIWEPALGEASYERVYIVPDGTLWSFPFGCLAEKHEGSWRYEIERELLVVCPSARSLRQGGETPLGKGGASAVFGDPNYDATLEQRQAAFASDAKGTSADIVTPHSGILVTSSKTMEGTTSIHLDRLPETRELAEQIGTILRKAGFATDVFLGDEASEERLRMLKSPKLLHIGTHGLSLGTTFRSTFGGTGLALAGANHAFDGVEQTPQDTLVPDNNLAMKPIAEDGVVVGYEAGDLTLDGTQLVTLMACGSGVGTSLPGRGVEGLVSAIARAGAQSQLFALWSVPTRESSRLMTTFYEKWLLGGGSRDRALNLASTDMIRELRATHGSAHPFFWGGFVYFKGADGSHLSATETPSGP